MGEDSAGFKERTEKLVLSTYAQVKTTRGFTLITSNTDFEKAYSDFINDDNAKDFESFI